MMSSLISALLAPSQLVILFYGSCAKSVLFGDGDVLDVDLLLVEERIPSADMAVSDRDAGEWRLVECLHRLSLLLSKGNGHQRVAIATGIFVPLEREDDALVLFHFADDTAKPRKTVLLRRHGAAPRSTRHQLPIQLDRGEFLGSPPSEHVIAAFPKPEHKRNRRVEFTLDQQFILANVAHCFLRFFGALVSSVSSASIRSKLPDQNLRYRSSQPS